ncbi:hypothetical protein Landi51_13731 [Colletotrichum acutatum]
MAGGMASGSERKKHVGVARRHREDAGATCESPEVQRDTSAEPLNLAQHANAWFDGGPQTGLPGELKSNPSADTASKAWIDLGRYAREVLAAQDTRRFVMGFTLCGSLMRVWAFDRLGALASEHFDINKDGLQFVSKAHPKGHPETPLVIKDSWQYPERDEEGDLLREVTDKGIVNVARPARQQQEAALQPTRLRFALKQAVLLHVSNKGAKYRPIRFIGASFSGIMASSRSALLAALVCCVDAHKSLSKAGILHRDSAFLIDLDLAVREPREGSSGAKGKTGTRAFMAIGALLGEQHSFMHDLESFFWVLFWICIHYDADGKDVGLTGFDRWNYESDDTLAELKMGVVADEQYFQQKITESFTAQYQPLVPWVKKLRREVFPSGRKWNSSEPGLYSSMRQVLDDARKDPEVLANT